MNLESKLQLDLLLAAPVRLPTLRLFRRNIGKARMKGGYVVKFAIPGQCDLYGMTMGGQHYEIELKSPGKELEPDQMKWRDWCLEWRVPHIVLTALKGETETETVERWLEELGDLLAQKS